MKEELDSVGRSNTLAHYEMDDYIEQGYNNLAGRIFPAARDRMVDVESALKLAEENITYKEMRQILRR